MNQPITGYHLDEEGDRVAELACGHQQHVRHQPPFVNRAWSVTEKGRRKKLGSLLNCMECDEEQAGKMEETNDSKSPS